MSGDGKRSRILDAAQDLFIRYGMKRTSIDDVARAADIAKGTLYLYFDSKELLFTEVAKKICAEILVEAKKEASKSASFTDRLVGILDAEIGFMQRLRLMQRSPHIRELTETKEAIASGIFAALDRDIKKLIETLLREEGLSMKRAADIFIATAVGLSQQEEVSAKSYRVNLRAMVDIVVLGLREDEKIKMGKR